MTYYIGIFLILVYYTFCVYQSFQNGRKRKSKHSIMAKERLLLGYKGILENKRKNNDIVSFCPRYVDPKPAYRSNRVVTPNDIKKLALESRRMDIALNELSIVTNKDKNELRKEIAAMMDEIGLDKKIFVIRWLGVLTTKVLCTIYNNIYVNESKLLSIKSTMGSNPIVLVPSHRSYIDFIVSTYILYCYDIELPATATGTNLQAMAIFGKILKKSHGFFIRRSFATDKVYSTAFRHYVRTLISKYHAPISFFIEGTRSRSGKSLPPKLGFLSMLMEPFFTGEIPDITFVPLSLSFERLLEEKLYTYEMLGVPKPKESASGVFRALRSLNECCGNVYLNFGTPFSALECYGSTLKTTLDTTKPLEIGELSNDQKKLIQKLAHEIVYKQESTTMTMTIQLVFTAVMVSLHNEKPTALEELEKYVIWLSSVIKKCGGSSFDHNIDNVKGGVNETLSIHKHTLFIDKDKRVRLINSPPFMMTDEIRNRMKGHELSERTMSSIMPPFMIQLYVNGILHWFTSHFLLYHIVLKSPTTKAELWEQYQRIRLLLKYEFPCRDDLTSEFDKTLDDLKILEVLRTDDGRTFILGSNEKLQSLFEVLFWPFLTAVHRLSIALCSEAFLEEKKLIKSIQEMFEWQLLNKEDIHPYCLSLECIQNCIQGFVAVNALKKQRTDKAVTYIVVNPMEVSKLSAWIKSLLPQKNMKFCLNNPVMIDYNVMSR